MVDEAGLVPKCWSCALCGEFTWTVKLMRDCNVGSLWEDSTGSDNSLNFSQTNIKLCDWLQLLSPLWILSWTQFSICIFNISPCLELCANQKVWNYLYWNMRLNGTVLVGLEMRVMIFLKEYSELGSEGVLMEKSLCNTVVNFCKFKLVARGWRDESCFHIAGSRERVNIVSVLQHKLYLPTSTWSLCGRSFSLFRPLKWLVEEVWKTDYHYWICRDEICISISPCLSLLTVNGLDMEFDNLY